MNLGKAKPTYPNTSTSLSFIAWRFYLILFVIAALVLVLIWRVFDLAILDQPTLRRAGDLRVIRAINTKAPRGMIVDRNLNPMAVSTLVYSAWINPKVFAPSTKELNLIASYLDLTPKSIYALLYHSEKQNREFVYLKRALPPTIAAKIKSLKIPGIYLQEDYRRYYPEGEVSSQVIGFTNVDDQGQEGLELFYNKWLQGKVGKQKVIKDRLGRVIADVETNALDRPGKNLILSIDRRIQYLAYRELLRGILINQAQSGSVVVLDVRTGEVLAMVNCPSFNPNNRGPASVDSYRNRAVTDMFEPGSTLKAFSIASVFENSKITPDTLIDTNPGRLVVGHNIVNDENHNYGLISVTKILQKSSNVGVSKLILSIPPNKLWEFLHQLGFGEETGIGFPGESSGVLVKRERWGAFMLATLSFGYGMSVTALQLARAYAVIANHGVKMPLSLLRIENGQGPIGTQVISPKLAKLMLLLLETVVTNKEGTGKLADIAGYRVAGKTGTSKISGIGGYQKGKYVSSFVGIAPVSNPRLVVAVIIHEPKGKGYHGGEVSAPVFEHIMEGTLRLLNVPPDD
jgi:cell division protein FtsI (penicillin-binding protein 3)